MNGKMLFYRHLKARSSVGERFLDTEEVRGSIPLAPTNKINKLEVFILPQTYRLYSLPQANPLLLN